MELRKLFVQSKQPLSTKLKAAWLCIGQVLGTGPCMVPLLTLPQMVRAVEVWKSCKWKRRLTQLSYSTRSRLSLVWTKMIRKLIGSFIRTSISSTGIRHSTWMTISWKPTLTKRLMLSWPLMDCTMTKQREINLTTNRDSWISKKKQGRRRKERRRIGSKRNKRWPKKSKMNSKPLLLRISDQ